MWSSFTAKGFDLVIKAIAKLKNTFPKIKLVVLGEGPEKDNLQTITRELGIVNNVEFRGFVKNVAEIMGESEVFVLSSYYEGFGNVIVESMAVGTPVVATNCPYGPGEIITHLENGMLTEIGKSEQIAEAIKKLFEDNNLYHKIQQKGFERAKQFTPENIASTHEALFKKIVQYQ